VFALGGAIGGGAVLMLGPLAAPPTHVSSVAPAPGTAPRSIGATPDAASASLDAGYIPAETLEAAKFLPTPPDGARKDADRRVFQETRALKGSARWAMAQNDANQNPEATLKDFSCAIGAQLTPLTAPATFALVQKFAHDQTPILEPAKAFYKRERPFVGGQGEICIAKTDELLHSPDYPSGHGAWGWAVALILAEAEPDRANAILARGRAFGESRVICGAHNASAVEAGQAMGAAMVAAAHSVPAFRTDVELAANELELLRRSGAPPPDVGQCAAEQALVAKTGY
jgi:acid phosphatase (class A)